MGYIPWSFKIPQEDVHRGELQLIKMPCIPGFDSASSGSLVGRAFV